MKLYEKALVEANKSLQLFKNKNDSPQLDKDEDKNVKEI